ncbi:hypothetical protein N9H90_03365 [Pseudomonadales bacterium]|nr:hypothetical protein [Pseudomonadales bacterium]
MGLYFNSVLFAIMGLVITLAMFRDQWLAMLVAIAAAIIARVVAVGVSCWCARPLSTPISLAWQGLLVWGGLRGAIAIAFGAVPTYKFGLLVDNSVNGLWRGAVQPAGTRYD